MFRSKLSARLPDSRSIVPVFAVASLVLYGWTFISIFWQMNSWRMNLTVWDILSLISYSMVKSFLETAIIIVLVLGLSFILPPKIWKEKFIVRGSIAALGVLLSMIAHIKLREAGVEAEILRSVSLWWLASLTLTAILVGLLPKIKLVEYVVSEIADRTVVFLYIFLPVTAIGFFALIVRFLISL